MTPRKIAILGVNGQVGAELSQLLSEDPGCEVTGFVRAEYGAALCKLTGIPYRIVDANSNLSEFPVVIDASIPNGNNTSLTQDVQSLIGNWMSRMKPGSTFVSLSSIWALGMPWNYGEAVHFRIPRSVYGHAKRQAERFVLNTGRSLGLRVLVIRLGQVHGILQAPTQDFIDKLSLGNVAVNGSDTDLTNTVFTCELANFFTSRMDEGLKDGVYNAISSPQWSQGQLFAYYGRRYGCEPRIQYGMTIERPSLLNQVRPLVEAFILGSFPRFALTLKGWQRKRLARHRTLTEEDRSLLNLLGRCPQPQLNFGLTSDEIARREKALQERLSFAIRKRMG